MQKKKKKTEQNKRKQKNINYMKVKFPSNSRPNIIIR